MVQTVFWKIAHETELVVKNNQQKNQIHKRNKRFETIAKIRKSPRKQRRFLLKQTRQIKPT